jgi:nicotinate-nucleotide pyrophosphorylase (carboxylating)
MIVVHDFHQIDWDGAVEEDCRQIIRLAIREDLDRTYDWTTVSLVPAETRGHAAIVARRNGVIAGLPAARLALEEMDAQLQWSPNTEDGAAVSAGDTIAIIEGPARSLLTAERLVLNLIGRLSGIATLTRRYVDAVAGTKAHIYDTRKTTPGWRRLEKYAVRRGGGRNHRTGLFDAILIKDNHLALGAAGDEPSRYTPAEAVARARQFVRGLLAEDPRAEMIVEVEIETLDQLDSVLAAQPDIVLLDNMPPEELASAVARRDQLNRAVQLEASGGVNLDTIGKIAQSGVDRISVGALTHSAMWFDVALEWN